MPSLEHDNEVKGESLDLIKYIDSNFEGPSLLPDVRFRSCLHDLLLGTIYEGADSFEKVGSCQEGVCGRVADLH